MIEDFNADGKLDLLVINREDVPSLFVNQGPLDAPSPAQGLGNFLRVELSNGAVNPQGIGASISVKTGNRFQTKTVAIGGGHASGQMGFSHFGLGQADIAQVRVKWPHTGWSAPFQVFANTHVILDRETNSLRTWHAID